MQSKDRERPDELDRDQAATIIVLRTMLYGLLAWIGLSMLLAWFGS